MIGLVKKKKKKVKPGYKKKIQWAVDENAARPSVRKIALAVVPSAKQNAKHFKAIVGVMCSNFFMRTKYLHRKITLKTANCT